MPMRCLDKAPLLRSCALLMLSAAALPLLASSARAQYKQPILSIGFGGGAIVPVGKAQDDFKSGYTGQGFLLVHLGPLPAIRINLAFQKFDYKEALGIPDGHSNVFSGTGGLQIFLIPGPVRPYITAGLGAFSVKSVSDSVAGTITTTSKVHFGIDGGAGLSLRFGRVSAFGEGRVQNVYTNDTGVVNRKSITQIPILFGLLIGL
ncbi:MAG TPA: outer membrane beta-barrel protein [Gemmatimonadaceae bacterium]|nr:outer membrane beta-barrel protein [Gemmatimonadaceae bacterium]